MGWLTALREDIYPATPFPDFADGATFGLATARAMAWAAQLAYEVRNEPKLDRILNRWGWRPRNILARQFNSVLKLTSTKGFVAISGDMTIISFAGTEPTSVANWLTDLAFFKTPFGIHEGFQAGADVVWSQVRAAGANAAGGIFLTGHSLGAAIAALSAQRLLAESVITSERLIGIYTIGMPRAGNEAFAAGYDSDSSGLLGLRTYRLVHGEDIVPDVPPASPPFGFRHVGRLLACPRGGSFDPAQLEPPAPERPQAGSGIAESIGEVIGAGSARVLAPYPGEAPVARAIVDALPASLRDHIPDRYLAALSHDSAGG